MDLVFATRNFDSFLFFALLALTFSFANATCDPGPEQDFCVGIDNPFKGVFVNGKFCKNPEEVTVEDFIFRGLDRPSNTTISFGIAVNERLIREFPGLNTQGIGISRIDLSPNGGMNPSNVHPRSSEIIHVTKGKILAGFVSSRENNYRLFTKVLKPGQGMVIPFALPHFYINVGKSRAVAFLRYNSQNTGLQLLANSVFQTDVPIDANILARSYKIAKKWARMIQVRFESVEINN